MPFPCLTYRLAARQERFLVLQQGDELRCLAGRVALRHASSDLYPTGEQLLIPSQAWRANGTAALTVQPLESAVVCVTCAPSPQEIANGSGGVMRLLQRCGATVLRWRRSLSGAAWPADGRGCAGK